MYQIQYVKKLLFRIFMHHIFLDILGKINVKERERNDVIKIIGASYTNDNKNKLR